jgi:hypothetical protein
MIIYFFNKNPFFKAKMMTAFIMQTAFFSQVFTGELIETPHIEKLQEAADTNTLILSDITNTLYKPCNTMSNKKWRIYLANQISEVVSDPDLASQIAKRLEYIIVNQVDKDLVHQNMPYVIKELQAREVPLIAISVKNWAMPYDPDYGIATSNHLKKLDIDLEKSVPLLGKMKSGLDATYEPIQDVNITEEYTFAKGIIFTNTIPLNVALDAFLNRLERKPQRIIILENSYDHREKLETVIKAHNIAVTFFKHVSIENQGKTFDPTLGTIEFLEFMENSKVIRDEEAKIIKEENSSVDFESLLKEFIKGYQLPSNSL